MLIYACIPRYSCHAKPRWANGQFYVNKVVNVQAAEDANVNINKKMGATVNIRKKKGWASGYKLATLLAGWPTVEALVGH